jgi:hypothetical protein
VICEEPALITSCCCFPFRTELVFDAIVPFGGETLGETRIVRKAGIKVELKV